MVSTLDILYIVLAICCIILTCVLTVLGIEAIRVVKDVRKISNNVEHISTLIERIALIVFPGIERVARGADTLEKKVESFIKKKVDKFTNL
jgi:hypothetical protein